MKKLIGLLILGLVLFGAAFGGAYYYQQQVNEKMAGEVQTVAVASLTGLKEQAKLTPFVARFVAVVTSKHERFGLTAERTMIMPGLVRYEIDLKALKQRDITWDAQAKVLNVIVPPIQVAGPEVELDGIREYGAGGILTALTDVEEVLDDANRRRAQDQLLRQARAEVPMQLARDAARSAIERSFTMPLRAAGITAAVKAKFADENEEGAVHGDGEEADHAAPAHPPAPAPSPAPAPTASNTTAAHQEGH